MVLTEVTRHMILVVRFSPCGGSSADLYDSYIVGENIMYTFVW
jgi:hypothetical protein